MSTYYMSKLFPKHNTSTLLQSGHALQSQAIRLTKDTFLLDTSLPTPKLCPSSDLTHLPKSPLTTRFPTKCGFLDKLISPHRVQKHVLERFFIDLIAGDDRSKDRAAARFNDVVLGPEATDGDQIILPRKFRQRLAGVEIRRAQLRNGYVNGFIVSKVKGGYSVAVAGFIAFLPNKNFMMFPRNRFQSGKFNVNSLSFKF